MKYTFIDGTEETLSTEKELLNRIDGLMQRTSIQTIAALSETIFITKDLLKYGSWRLYDNIEDCQEFIKSRAMGSSDYKITHFKQEIQGHVFDLIMLQFR